MSTVQIKGTPLLNTKRKSDLANDSIGATPDGSLKDINTHKSSAGDHSERATSMNAEAYQALQTLEQLLEMTLTVDDRQDWDNLVNAKTFESTLTPRPYIKYGEYGAPVDIEYLNMSEPKPEEPELKARPVLSSFKPQLGVLDKLAFREQKLIKGAQDAFAAALRQWESDRQQAMANYVRQSKKWTESAKAMDAENAKRYQQCVEDQQLWLQQKKLFDEKCNEARASIDSFMQAYPQHEASAAQL